MTRDPGLQPERTALAWVRTSVALLVNALIVLRGGLSHHQPALLVLGGVLLALAAGGATFAGWRRRQLDAAPGAPPAVALQAVVGATFLAAAGGLASIAVAWR